MGSIAKVRLEWTKVLLPSSWHGVVSRFQLKQDHPNWPDAVDATYKAIPETASMLMDQVRKGKKAEAK